MIEGEGADGGCIGLIMGFKLGVWWGCSRHCERKRSKLGCLGLFWGYCALFTVHPFILPFIIIYLDWGVCTLTFIEYLNN